ncbi:MAG: hypothetical protein A2Y33_15990 [Spirochaetes bacterium GWF1_51_8]|nr:MAG: hypothetical protein A2Y33_15990 [Spirochaetes bacterium GWF1_51_8]
MTDMSGEERRSFRKPMPLYRHLSRFVNDVVPERQRILGRVREFWGSATGPQIAAHTIPEDIDNRNLIVNVDDPSWLAELALMKDDIYAQLKKRIPDIKRQIDKIRFRNGQVLLPEKEAERKRPPAPVLSPEAYKEIDAELESIEDQALKRSLRKLLIRTYNTTKENKK